MKLACSRPFAEQKPANRADPAARLATSLVSWPWRKVAASAPLARITPRSARRQTPPIEIWSGMRHYHQPTMVIESARVLTFDGVRFCRLG